MSLFEKASRLKFRYDSPKGPLPAEDLWDLPLTSPTGKANLDDIAKGLHKQLKSGDDVSFVIKEKKSDQTVQDKFDLVLYVIKTKQAENDAANRVKENAEKQRRIMEIIQSKKDKELESKSVEELEKLFASMSS